jgi:hypothetical protein
MTSPREAAAYYVVEVDYAIRARDGAVKLTVPLCRLLPRMAYLPHDYTN